MNAAKILKYSYLGVSLSSLVTAIALLADGSKKLRANKDDSKAKEEIGPGVVLLLLAITAFANFLIGGSGKLGAVFLVFAALAWIGGIATTAVGFKYLREKDVDRANQILPAAILTIILGGCCLAGAATPKAVAYSPLPGLGGFPGLRRFNPAQIAPMPQAVPLEAAVAGLGAPLVTV